MVKCDFLVIGGGIIGISIVRELKKRHPKSSQILIEKEVDFGLHASGRNSGVLHAGFIIRRIVSKPNSPKKETDTLQNIVCQKIFLLTDAGSWLLPRMKPN